MTRGRMRSYLGRYKRAIGVVLALSVVFVGITYYTNAPYADACNGHFTDRGLDKYFAKSGRNGLSWGSAYIFNGLNYTHPLQQFGMIFDHTTRYVIIKGCEFINSSSGDGAAGGAIKISHSRNIKILNCLFNGGDGGIFIEHSQDLEITNSSFKFLTGTALQLNYVHDVLVKNNIFFNNGLGIGISEGSHQTTLTLNNFTANTIHAHDASSNSCTWSYNGLGNYWGDYFTQCPTARVSHDNSLLDSLANGVTGAVFIGMIPYSITSGTQDNFPLIFLPNIAPIIDISSPIEESVWGEGSPDYCLNITGHLITSAWYTFDGSTNFTMGVSSDFPFIGTRSFAGLIDQTHWEMLVSGEICISFHAKTWFGVESVRQVHVVKDTLAPIILINDPVPDQLFGSTPPAFSLSITEVHLSEIWYTCNNAADILVPIQGTSGSISSFIWGACGDGCVFIHFFARDIIGNTGSVTVRVMKDTVPPAILVITPATGEVYGNSSVNIQFESHDTQLDSAWVTIGGIHVMTFGNEGVYAGILPIPVWNACCDGPVEIGFGSNDSLGNTREQSMTIYKDSTPPIVNFNFLHANIAGSIPPEVCWAYNDASLVVAAWYTLGNSTTLYDVQINSFTFSLNANGWGALPDGAVRLNLFVRDICGNIGSFSSAIIKDTSLPSLTIIRPLANDAFGRNGPSYEIRVSDLSLKSIEYHLNGSLLNCHIAIDSGQDGIFSGHFDTEWWNLLQDGVLNITFDVSDALGNTASNFVIVKKDTCPPFIAVIHPLDNGMVSSIPPAFEVNASDSSYVHRIWYSLDGGRTLVFLPLNTFTGSFDSGLWSSAFVPGRNLTIVFWANDTLGNVASTSITVRCENSGTWNLFHGCGLFASLLVVSVVLLAVILVLEAKHHPKGGKRSG